MGIDLNARITSNKIDLQTIMPIILLFGIPIVVSQFEKGKSNSALAFSFNNGWLFVLCIGIAVLFCKDCIYGQSPGKRVLGLQVINYKTKKIASPLRCLIRDLFMVLTPVEAIFLLVDPTRRLGDYIAGTELAPFNADLKIGKINYVEIGISFLLAYAFSLVFLVIAGQF